MGMLFDHGCDAMTSVMSAFIIGKLFSLGGGVIGLCCFILPCLSFFFFTLQEYYLGYMLLPALSGPDDTQLAFVLFCFLIGYQGTDYFKNLSMDIPLFNIGEQNVPKFLVGLFTVIEFTQIFVDFYSNMKTVHG